MRKLILYISMSIDGFIAGENDDLSWLSQVEKEGEDYGYNDFTAQVDTYIVGRKTYEVVKGLCGGQFPPAQKFKCYVVSRQSRKSDNEIRFYNGDLKELIAKLKSEKGANIYCDGGAQLVKLLLQQNLIDEFIISIIPTMLGGGTKLFEGGYPALNLELISSKSYESGLVQVRYRRR